VPRIRETFDFSLPPAFIRAAAKLAREEHRTPRQLCAEMLRIYKQHRKQQEPYDQAWALKLIHEVKEEDRIRPKTQEELNMEDEELLRYGEAQAKKLGIKEKDVPRLVRERRAERRRHASRS
jgi:hypothetical protein